ncbi:MAG: GNAT family N-acetyltransferase [Hyphomonas sp.]|uniref:GNAT family N-acetyltransferase n=1 Tax=Hyphomonas sp. TaxID=87 RepID=UPI00352901BE
MSEEIRTDRLVLRRKLISDAPRIHRLVSDPRIHRNVGRIPANQTLEETEAFIRKSIDGEENGEYAGFAVEKDGELIGLVGGRPNGVHGPFDIGYWLAPDEWGQGLATEAARAFRDWLNRKRGIRAMTSAWFLDNPGSGRVLAKLDFLPAGRMKHYCYGRDERVECMEMAWIAPNA